MSNPIECNQDNLPHFPVSLPTFSEVFNLQKPVTPIASSIRDEDFYSIEDHKPEVKEPMDEVPMEIEEVEDDSEESVKESEPKEVSNRSEDEVMVQEEQSVAPNMTVMQKESPAPKELLQDTSSGNQLVQTPQKPIVETQSIK